MRKPLIQPKTRTALIEIAFALFLWLVVFGGILWAGKGVYDLARQPKPKPTPQPITRYYISTTDVTWEVESRTPVSNEFLAGVCTRAGQMAQQARLYQSARENYRLAKRYRAEMPSR